MPRPSPELLDASRYATRYLVGTRYADIDPNQHINNVAMSAMLEDVRVRFDRRAGLDSLGSGLRVMVAAVYVDYLAEAHYPEPLEIAMAVLEIGRTSWTVGQLALQGDRPCAFCRAVVVSTGGDGPAPLSDDFRARLATDLLRRK